MFILSGRNIRDLEIRPVSEINALDILRNENIIFGDEQSYCKSTRGGSNMSKYHSIIRYPSITEKNTTMRETQNKYVFEVERTAKKPDIKEAVEKLFAVTVLSVNTILVKGKKKRMGTKCRIPLRLEKSYCQNTGRPDYF